MFSPLIEIITKNKNAYKPIRQREVMKMQYELLRNRFDDHETNAPAANLIKSMADGTRTHHASALKFGLREGFSRTGQATAEPAPPPPPVESQLSLKKKKKGRK